MRPMLASLLKTSMRVTNLDKIPAPRRMSQEATVSFSQIKFFWHRKWNQFHLSPGMQCWPSFSRSAGFLVEFSNPLLL